MAKVRVKENNQIMKSRISAEYYYVGLNNNENKRKTLSVYRLATFAFVKNQYPDKYKIVDHIDNNKFNNNADNLRWTNQRGNMLAYQKYRKDLDKPIKQYDLKENLIKIWKNSKELFKENPNFVAKTFFPIVSQNGKYKGFISKYTKKDTKKDIIYENDDYGKVKNIKSELLLTPRIIGKYYNISLAKYNIQYNYSVHRLVAMKFVKGQNKIDNIVNHLDENTLNNYYKNLEWTNN